ADVKRTFSHLTRIVPRNGWVVMNGDDENLASLGELPWTRVVRVGTGANCNVRITNFEETAAGVTFRVLWEGVEWGAVSWAMPGIYNARNAAMAAVAAALAVRGEVEGRASRDEGQFGFLRHFSLAPLARFRGVKRRQEVLVSKPGITVIEDFGHHPTALAETLKSFRNRFPGAVITAVFEPRSNTARTNTLQAGFMAALALADEVYLGAVSRADKLKADERFDTEAVIAHVVAQGRKGTSGVTNAEVLEKLVAATLPAVDAKPRLVVFFSNGSFDGIIAKYATTARALGEGF
ncbi:MAG: Mur ligase, partial [Opitutaceae bacterium]|nr:Mur ligase [Opitutaceae bacterium]